MPQAAPSWHAHGHTRKDLYHLGHLATPCSCAAPPDWDTVSNTVPMGTDQEIAHMEQAGHVITTSQGDRMALGPRV